MIHPDVQAAVEFLEAKYLTGAAGKATGVRDALYAWYLNPGDLPSQGGPVLPYELSMSDAIRAAHVASTRFSGGWRAETVSTWGRVVASRGEVTRLVDRSEYLAPLRRGLRAEPGEPLSVSQCWDWVDEDTNFWHTRRGEWPPQGADRLVRVYWNGAPSVMPALVSALTGILDSAPEFSYMIKTSVVPDQSGRADALVLYLGPAGYEAIEEEIARTAREFSNRLRDRVPRFTAGIGRGVAVAEGSVEGDSFGESRTALIAEAFDAATEGGRRDTSDLERKIRRAFCDAGLDEGRPYLESMPVRDYV